jgi:SAM-dependent methyltransferase
MEGLDAVYAHRFDDAESLRKDRVWSVLGPFLQRWVDPEGPVLDLACDRGYFIRNVRAAERWATDVRDLARYLPPEVRFVRRDGLELADALPAAHFGTVFMSNYLEHLRSPEEVVRQLRVARDLLQPAGRLVILQPNIRLVGGSYWDFIDHRVALTEKSLAEAAEVAGFRKVAVITRFLPFTTKGRLSSHPVLVRAYLRCWPAWWLLGKQSLYVGERRA